MSSTITAETTDTRTCFLNHLTVLGPTEDLQNFKRIGANPGSHTDKRRAPVVSRIPFTNTRRLLLADSQAEPNPISVAEVAHDCEKCVIYAFVSSETPALEFTEALAPAWPNLTFVLHYEELCGNGEGMLVAKEGHVQQLSV